MHRLLSPFLVEQHQAGNYQGDLQAASLFVDISGFSQMTYALMDHGQHGAELLASIMCQLYDPLVEKVYGHDGFITVFAGDAFTALFPAAADAAGAVAWRPALERALAAGWGIREQLLANSVYEAAHGRFEVGIKVALALGDCHWQIVTAEKGERATFYFRGTAVDAAANAEKDAQKNWLVVTPAAAAILGDTIRTIEAGAHQRLLALNTPLPLPADVALAEIASAVIHRFFPPEVSEAQHSGEFRRVINLFVSLQGALSNEQVVRFAQTLLALQATYGGLLNRIDFGDKGCSALLFWGAPQACERMWSVVWQGSSQCAERRAPMVGFWRVSHTVRLHCIYYRNANDHWHGEWAGNNLR